MNEDNPFIDRHAHDPAPTAAQLVEFTEITDPDTVLERGDWLAGNDQWADGFAQDERTLGWLTENYRYYLPAYRWKGAMPDPNAPRPPQLGRVVPALPLP